MIIPSDCRPATSSIHPSCGTASPLQLWPDLGVSMSSGGPALIVREDAPSIPPAIPIALLRRPGKKNRTRVGRCRRRRQPRLFSPQLDAAPTSASPSVKAQAVCLACSPSLPRTAHHLTNLHGRRSISARPFSSLSPRRVLGGTFRAQASCRRLPCRELPPPPPPSTLAYIPVTFALLEGH